MTVVLVLDVAGVGVAQRVDGAKVNFTSGIAKVIGRARRLRVWPFYSVGGLSLVGIECGSGVGISLAVILATYRPLLFVIVCVQEQLRPD